MQEILLDVETLAFEAHEDDVVDHLLATDGVLAATFDVVGERINVTFDPSRVAAGRIEDILAFFGIVVKAS